MKRLLFFAAAIFLGIAAGEYLTTDFAFRAWLGRLVRGDELVALVDRVGVYRHDERSLADAKVRSAAQNQPVAEAAIDHEMDLLRWQFPDEKSWNATLERAGMNARALRREVAQDLRDRAWLETKLPAQIPPNEKEERMFYEANPARFAEPLRFRASHLFLAAPVGYPDEVIETKRKLSEALAARLRNGESFDALVVEFSEDEGTKNHGGDLNCFDAARMLPEIFAAAQTMKTGQTSAPIRSRLGFHILRLTSVLPARELTIAEAAPEIEVTLENERRAQALGDLSARMAQTTSR
ncbi:MAG: peptidylprolyl isomerase [Chthoniobacterales bacterium]|nr:peptidylprolyl isomerase [Chthoniobacterales bacterium]